MDTIDALCKTTHFLRRSGKTWSATLTLLLTIERYLCIAHPLKAGLCSKSVTMATIIISFLMCFSLTIPLLQYDMVYDFLHFCFVEITKRDFYETYDLAAIRILGEGVIGILIFIFTCLIIFGLFKARQRSKEMGVTAEKQKSRSAQDAQINNMLLVIVCMFFLTQILYTVTYFLFTDNATNYYLSAWQARYVFLSMTLSRAFSTLNYSTNFVIYLVFARMFRSNLTGVHFNINLEKKNRFTSSDLNYCYESLLEDTQYY